MKPVIVPFFISHRGCPHACAFCDQRTVTGNSGELPSASVMTATIEAYRRTSRRPAVEVAFYGGTFTALPPQLQEELLMPLQPLLADRTVSGVRLSTRPDAVDADNADLLRRLGVRLVELGAQSMDDRVLALAGRGHLARHTEAACAVLKEAGLQVGMQLMPGLPGGSVAEALSSCRRVLALKPDCLRIYPTLVLAGTRLADWYAAGEYRPLTMDDAVASCKGMLRMAELAGVPVIRLGLQPTDELSGSAGVIAGPYHPAFRQLVEGELWYELLSRLATSFMAGTDVRVTCHPARVSEVIGQRRRNLTRLLDHGGIRVTRVYGRPDLPLTALVMENGTAAHAGDRRQICNESNDKQLFVLRDQESVPGGR